MTSPTKKTDADIEALARAIADAMPTLGSRDRRMAVFIYHGLAMGNPVGADAIAAHCGVDAATLDERLAAWPGVGVDDAGAVVSFWGLALEGMPHGFEVDGQSLTTWCAWDAFFIPGIIGKSAKVKSTCPVSGESVALRVDPEGVSEVTPATAAISIQRPAKAFGADVVPSF